MELVGCSCAGFSYTEKYKKAIVSFSEWVDCNINIGLIEYQQLQNLVAENGVSLQSEVRMIVPFLVKVGIINEANCIRGGSRIRALIINNEFFTHVGKCFVQFLKVELQKEMLPSSESRALVEKIFKQFSFLQFQNLLKSDEVVYRNIIKFLVKYQTMDKYEFFILTTLQEENKNEMLDDIISKYRSGDIAELTIVGNVNAFQYIMNLMIQFGIVERTNIGIALTSEYKAIMEV